jgi:glutamine cyclotransferase
VFVERQLPKTLFGEGITRLDGRIYQLTWRENMNLIWSEKTLEPLGEFKLTGEGWGLCNDGRSLIISDGSATLRWLDPEDFSEQRSVTVTYNGQPLPQLNELEWVNGSILANVWLSDVVVAIDPDSGIVEGLLDLGGLLPERERRPDTDVLNGIAWDGRSQTLWVTGKHWPWLYQLRVPRLSKPVTEALQ